MNPTPALDRRHLDWSRIKTPADRLAVVTATFFGSGLLPWMPGTWGTLAAIPLAAWSNTWSLAPRIALWSLLLLAGTWASKRIFEVTGVADNQNIVMDEVVGLGITAWTCGRTPYLLLIAFVLFRFFDVVKVPPVRQVDLWSKEGSAWRIGFGVMADDLVAAFQGLLIIYLLQKYGVLAWGYSGGSF